MSRRPGRDAPCPCGSGERYKDCCMGREDHRSPTSTGPRLEHAADGGPESGGGGGHGAGPAAAPVDVKRASLGELLMMAREPFTSDEVGHELLRRLRLPTMRWTHDIRHDPHTLDGVDEGTRALLEFLYRDSGALDSLDIKRLEAMSTEGIIARLAEEGVEFDEEEFREHATGYTSAIMLADEEYIPRLTRPGPDAEDLVWMSIMLLWRRLLPGWPSVEELDEAMQAGYRHIEARHVREGLDSWGTAWTLVKALVPPTATSVEEADESLPVDISQCIFNWCQDYEEALGNASMDDPTLVGRRRAFIEELMARFPETGASIALNMGTALAECLAMSEDLPGAERVLRGLLEDHPDEPWAHIHLADFYWMRFRGPEPEPTPEDLARAEELYLAAPATDELDREAVEERLADLRSKRGALGM